LTAIAVLVAAVLIFVPDLARERRAWLHAQATEANIAALSVAKQGPPDAQLRDGLLRLLNAAALYVRQNGQVVVAIVPDGLPSPRYMIDLPRETRFTGAGRALAGLLFDRDALVAVRADSPVRPGAELELVISHHAMTQALRRFAVQFALVAIVIAGFAAAIVFLAAHRLLVRPMRSLIQSIIAFRKDPEGTPPLDPKSISASPNDEMAVAGRELAAMQQELRAALWRNAKLAALGAAMAKMSHDLRGILAPALLTADSLQLHQDPAVRRAGDTLVRAVDRATDLVRRSLEYTREGPPQPRRERLVIADVVNEAAEALRETLPEFVVENRVPRGLAAEADHHELWRVLVNLLRNAAEAGASTARVRAVHESEFGGIEIEDDGPGLPDAVRANLFKPFIPSSKRGGSGLGLAIARDLMRAQRGDIELVSTGSSGTVFRLTLPGVRRETAEPV
jgi:signal transduction histidine kinase